MDLPGARPTGCAGYLRAAVKVVATSSSIARSRVPALSVVEGLALSVVEGPVGDGVGICRSLHSRRLP